METYLLDWQETMADGQQPTPTEVYQWLAMQGFVLDGQPKVYANGTVQVRCEPDPTEAWQRFKPLEQTPSWPCKLPLLTWYRYGTNY